MRHYFLIFSLLFVQCGFAQTVWKGALPTVEKSGYYNIELNQELVGAGLNLMKILDEDNNETPYFIHSTDPVKETSNFESYDLISNIAKDSLNIIIVDNKSAENLNRFCIILQQADTRKFLSLRGSNDLKQWYIVKQQTVAPVFANQTNENTEMLIIDFPQGNYRYYEITILNDQKSPLEVLRVGKIKKSNIYGNFIEVKSGKFIVENNKNDKNTYISFPELKHNYCINKIEFYIKNKPDYYRHVMLIDSISYNRNLFNLSSVNENIFFIKDFLFTPKTIVRIENKNNPPLIIDSLKLYSLCRYACLYLEAGKKYQISLNSEDPVSSKYDIEYFRDEISADIAVLQLENLRDYPTLPAPERELTIFENPVFLWSVIIIVGLFLIFICIRMAKEIKKK